MKDEKLIKKIRKELFSHQEKADSRYEKGTTFVQNYAVKLFDFQVVDLAAPELILKKQPAR